MPRYLCGCCRSELGSSRLWGKHPLTRPSSQSRVWLLLLLSLISQDRVQENKELLSTVVWPRPFWTQQLIQRSFRISLLTPLLPVSLLQSISKSPFNWLASLGVALIPLSTTERSQPSHSIRPLENNRQINWNQKGMSLTHKMRSLDWPTYPFSGWLCLFLLPVCAGFLPGAGVLWVINRSACAPQPRVYLCSSHPPESLNSCLQDRVDRVYIPEPSLWPAEGWPMSSSTPANVEGSGIIDPHWMGRRDQESPRMDWDAAGETRHQMSTEASYWWSLLWAGSHYPF